MKKISFVLVLFFLVGSLLFSCSKSGENKLTSDEQSSSMLKSEPENPNIVNLTCSGTCPNGDRCLFTIVGNNQYGECDCEGCTLIIWTEKGSLSQAEQGKIWEQLSQRGMFINNLRQFVKTKFGTDNFGIKSMEYATYNNDYYILYDFVTENGIEETVMYVSVAGKNSKEPPEQQEIDCSGTCTLPTETCRERYIFNPPSVECTCEGDNCKMTIKEI